MPIEVGLWRIGDTPQRVAFAPMGSENMVRVDWIKTVPVNEAIKEKGFWETRTSSQNLASKNGYTLSNVSKPGLA